MIGCYADDNDELRNEPEQQLNPKCDHIFIVSKDWYSLINPEELYRDYLCLRCKGYKTNYKCTLPKTEFGAY